LAETNDYDKIFTALKHPIRRQILLLLEKKGEVSFTEIQKAVDIDDTGLLSYHLKELTTLVEQSERGKYALSEIGRASMVLFRNVEREKQTTTVSVHRELEKITGEIVFLILIAAVASARAMVGFSNRHFKGVTGDVMGAMNELARMVSLIFILAVIGWA